MEPLKIMLAEQDPGVRERLMARAAMWDDLEVIGTAEATKEIVELLREVSPHALLLDLEEDLTSRILRAIRDAGLKHIPFLLTVGQTDGGDSDYVLHREQFRDNWPEAAVDTLRAFQDMARRKWDDTAKRYEEDQDLRRRIGEELDKVGISRRSAEARRYLVDAIRLTMEAPQPHLYYTLAKRYEREGASEATVALTMERAIDRAWRSPLADPEVLERHYRGRVSLYRRSPAVTEFVGYYAEKFRGE